MGAASGVRVRPGATQLTRMFFGAYEAAALSARPAAARGRQGVGGGRRAARLRDVPPLPLPLPLPCRGRQSTPRRRGRPRTRWAACTARSGGDPPTTPALAAAMASWLGTPCLATAELHSTMLPPPVVIMRFTLALSTLKAVNRLMRSVSSNSCSAGRAECGGREGRVHCWGAQPGGRCYPRGPGAAAGQPCARASGAPQSSTKQKGRGGRAAFACARRGRPSRTHLRCAALLPGLPLEQRSCCARRPHHPPGSLAGLPHSLVVCAGLSTMEPTQLATASTLP
jgi:hypothetical protein